MGGFRMVDQSVALARIAGTACRNDVAGDMLATFADWDYVILRQPFEFLAAIGAAVLIQGLDCLPFIARQSRFNTSLRSAGALIAHLAFQPNLLRIRRIPRGPSRFDLFRMAEAKFALLGREIVLVRLPITTLRILSMGRRLTAPVSCAISLAVVLAAHSLFCRDFSAMSLNPCSDVTGLAKSFGFQRSLGMTLSCASQYESNIP